MDFKRLSILLVAGVVSACGARPVQVPFGNDHPASPNAPEASAAPLSTTLTAEIPELGSPVVSPPAAHEHHHHAGTHTGTRSGSAAAPSPPPAQELYACPMHAEVRAHQPGRCPVCGMKLVRNPRGGDR